MRFKCKTINSPVVLSKVLGVQSIYCIYTHHTSRISMLSYRTMQYALARFILGFPMRVSFGFYIGKKGLNTFADLF